MKKMLSIVLAIAMVLSLATMAWADTTEVSVNNTDMANAALAEAITDTTIKLAAGEYGELTLVNTTNERTNITIVGEGDVTVDLIALGTSSSFNNITFRNIIFDGENYGTETGAENCHPGIYVAAAVNGMNVVGCTFKNSANISVGSNYSISNLIVDGCAFDQSDRTIAANYSPIYISGTSNGVTVKNSTFDESCANAIQVNGTVNGAVTINGNKINGTGDRALRFGSVQTGVTVLVENNNFTGSCVDEDGEFMKVTSIEEGANFTAKNLPSVALINVGDEVFFTGDFYNMTMNDNGEITGGTFSDEDVMEFVAEGYEDSITIRTASDDEDEDTSSEPTPEEIERDRIVAAIKAAADGDTVTLDVKKLDVISRFIADAMSGKNVNLEYTLGEETVTVNGRNVPKTPAYRVWYSLELFAQFA